MTKSKYICFDLIIFITILSILITSTIQYKEMIVESGQLCSVVKKSKLKLGNNHNSAILVKQTRLNEHALKWQTNFHCSFQISTAHPKEGIFAVIQQLVFRINSTTDECIDYVQFKGKDGSTSQKYCGRFNANLKMDYFFLDSITLKSTGNAFIDTKGELDVHIFVSKEELRDGEEMDLSIAFTSYRYCAESSNKYSRSDWIPCGDDYKDVCIYRDFINDGYVNCPYPGCVDEGGCNKEVEQEKNNNKYSVGNKVFIGSISTLALIFVAFILCIWACKKHKILCWAEEFARPSPPSEPSTTPRVMEMNEQTGARLSQAHLTPTAPAVEEDKDLPPSYDSLFPESLPHRSTSKRSGT